MVQGVRVTVTPDERDPGCVVVGLRGELDLATGGIVEERLRQVLADGGSAPVRRLVVDVSALDFADVSGIGVVLRAREQLEAAGGTLVLRRPSRQVRRLLSLLQLERDLAVED